MKKGIYIVYGDLDNTSGVNRKIKSQIQCFIDAGFEIETVVMKSDFVPGYKLLYRLPFTNLSPRWVWDARFEKCDFIYMRRPFFMNIYFLRFLKKVKKENPSVKIIMEIPTYPYDKEILKHKRNISLYAKEKMARGGKAIP